MPNTTLSLHGRSLEKRQIFSRCGNSVLSPLLAQAIQDAKPIMSNMVDHLDLAIGLYRSDGSGELRPDKDTSYKRTFDEYNAFANYHAFISNHYTGADAVGNREGLETLRAVMTESGDVLYWVLQKSATQEGKDKWVQRKLVCDADPDNPDYDSDEDSDEDSDSGSDDEADNGSDDGSDDETRTRFGVPVGDGLNAYIYKALYGTIEEIMVFCPSYHAQWLRVDSDRSGAGIHYRNLHVDVGQEPTDAHRQAAHDLLAGSDFQNQGKRGIKWLDDFLVQVFIHESTHAEAFTGEGNTLGEAALVTAIAQG
ncbi:hypothetical protein ACHAPT_009968 [Fusarium lateritium]